MKIKIPYTPRFPQTKIHPQLESHRFCVLVTHRQMGKTVCAVNHMLKRALQNTHQQSRYFYIAPYFVQARQIAWDYLKFYSRVIPGVKIYENVCTVLLPNGASLRVVGADNPDALRGTFADGIVLDEYGDIKPIVYDEIIRPMLNERKGWVLFFGTPKGQNQFYDVYCKAKRESADNPNGEWWCGTYRADETGVIDPEELARIEKDTPANIFRQEYLCDFTSSRSDVLIPIDLVLKARKRLINEAELRFAPRIMGVDVARFGADRSVIFKRSGLQAFEPLIFKDMDNMSLAARVAAEIKNFSADSVFIDAGAGSGVIDRLRQLGFGNVVQEVPFGSRPIKDGQYANKRAEMWGEMRDWLKAGGALPDKPSDLAGEMSLPTYDFDVAGKIRLESKEKIKERLGKSPDLADALALTFAAPVFANRGRTGDMLRRNFYEVEFEI